MYVKLNKFYACLGGTKNVKILKIWKLPLYLGTAILLEGFHLQFIILNKY